MSYKSTNYLKASLAMFIIVCAFLLQGCGSYKAGMVECGKNGYAGYGTPPHTDHGAARHSF